MNQKHTIITDDQPLYSRGKEFVWANLNFENITFLYVCFNFLKTEAGVYEANNTTTMRTDRVYYRMTPFSIRSFVAHQMANVEPYVAENF